MRRFFRINLVLYLTIMATNCLANDWQIKGLQVKNSQGLLNIKISWLQSPFLKQKIYNISYNCKGNGQVYPQHFCTDGLLEFDYDSQKYELSITGMIDIANAQWNIKLSNKEKNLALESNSRNSNKLLIFIKQMPLSDINEIIKGFVESDLENATAKVSADITIDLNSEKLIQANYEIHELNWESSDGNYVLADNLVKGFVELSQQQNQLEILLNVNIIAGEGLFKDIYVLFDDAPTNLVTQLKVDNDFKITSFNLILSEKDVFEARINAINLAQQQFTIDYNILDASKAYTGFLASYFEIIGINDLEIEGQSKGFLTFNNGEITSISSSIKDLYLEIASKKIEASNLHAQLNWKKHGDKQTSTFVWDSLLLAGMPIEQYSLDVYAVGQQLSLPKNTEIPLFDGSLLVNSLALKDIFEEDIAIDFVGEVKPISIALVTEKMGWAIMEGNISGKIPGMIKTGQSITFDGVLAINIFAGEMQISNLAIERLFGIAPVIAADINFEKLDMKLITSTFDFGEITGLISGYINELRITNWKADRLDAYVQSVKTKGIKQIISQRAIDNISSIGGIQGAVSRSFLRFFDNFKYKRIGIGCKLRNSICSMSGIKDSENNYTLIEGKGIPSINIMGFRKHIDWQVFLDRLFDANY